MLRRVLTGWQQLPVIRTRCYSQTASGAFHQRCQIPVRSSGHIDVDINYPPRPPLPSEPRRLILNLDANPSAARLGGLNSDNESYWERAKEEASIIATVADATVVTPHYRVLNPDQFPTPLHDIALSYDWALENLTGPGPAPHVAFTGLALGATFALSIGFTESRTDGPRCCGIAVSNPVLDWVFEGDARVITAVSDDAIPPARREAIRQQRQKMPAPTERHTDEANGLSRFRELIFPAAYPWAPFDAFASPAHFLRTASTTVPHFTRAPQPADARGEPAYDPQLEEQFAELMNLDQPAPNNASEEEVLDPFSADGRRFRRTLRWPPSGSGIVIPPVFIQQFEQSVLRPQGDEFVRLLRKAYVRSQVGPLTKGTHAGRFVEDGEDNYENSEEAIALKVKEATAKAEDMIQLEVQDEDNDSPWDVDAIGGRLGEMLDRT